VHEHVAAPVVAPAAFHEVSEHDQVEPHEDHRPNRRRKHEAAPPEDPALQLVETQAAEQAPAFDDDSPRRTKPRRRRGGPAASEPLQLVETQPEEPRADNPPTP
jgi:hypothetical protein